MPQRQFGESIVGEVKGDKLLLEIDLSKVVGASKAGNAFVATTGSYVNIGNGLKMQCIVLRPKAKE